MSEAATTTPPAPSAVDDERTAPRSWLARTFSDVPEASIALVVVVMFVGWSLATPNFLTADNLLSVAQQIAFLGIVATGLTFLLIAGELDLSVGSAYGFLAVLMAFLVDLEFSIVVAIAITFAVGAGVGAVNGLATTVFSVPSFIVTLGMLGVLRGLALGISDGLPVGPVESVTYNSLSAGRLFGEVPAQVVWLAVIALIGALVLAKTRFGYHVYATGGNRAAAAGAGIATGRTKLICFVLTGLLVALVAVLSVGWLGNANPLTGSGFELQAIAAVVIGGTSLFGGAGSILGTLLGAAVIGMLNNGLVLIGVDQYWQQFAIGAIILAAALLNVTLRKRLTQGSRG